jgi:NAD(P)-dependent dehydrogenase (short-subunit alcohol dehydrogenase family)
VVFQTGCVAKNAGSIFARVTSVKAKIESAAGRACASNGMDFDMSEFVARPELGIAWITGASSGIGKALALQLAGEGYTVAVTARDHAKLAALQVQASALSGKILVVDGDVTDPAEMERVVASIEYDHGRIALAVLNAGIYIPVNGENLHVQDFQKTFAVNLNGVVHCLVPLIRHMRAHGHGQIGIVSSVTGYGGLPTSAAYGASKAALINMAESLKFDLDKVGIRIQIINPGFVETAATSNNAFEMPALLKVEEAAKRIADGLKGQSFEITFPKRFTYVLKLMRFLPYSLYFRALNKATGWKNRKSS